jgi:hypothetical protein
MPRSTAYPLLVDDWTGSTLWPDHLIRDGESDVGYPIMVPFEDGSVFTCYWIAMADGITHAAATREPSTP